MPAKKTVKAKPRLRDIDEYLGLDGSEGQGKHIIQEIPIDKFTEFPGHPFRLLEGERLDDMAESIRTNGVLIPVIARKLSDDVDTFELLAGYHRREGSIMAGKSTLPAIVLENVSDDEAMVYVVETNLMQRSFTDMSHSEKAAVIAIHHGKMFSQGKRNDILEQLKALENPGYKEAPTLSHSGTELNAGQRTDEKIGEMYGLSRNTVARYVRIDKLIQALKAMTDSGAIPFLAAVDVSFLFIDEQQMLAECLEDGHKINAGKATELRVKSKAGKLDLDTMKSILVGYTATAEHKPRRVKISGESYGKYFTPEQSAKEVESIVEEALELYFVNRGDWMNEQR